jgi:hypothetical protein
MKRCLHETLFRLQDLRHLSRRTALRFEGVVGADDTDTQVPREVPLNPEVFLCAHAPKGGGTGSGVGFGSGDGSGLGSGKGPGSGCGFGIGGRSVNITILPRSE